MDEKISVIIPIYKVENYLHRCIDSVANQTYQNLEIILVDDGSPDNCPRMCDCWSKKDSRIKVIHKENGGLSDARNFGMAIATGAYIFFLDSDDWIHKEALQILLDSQKKTGADIVECKAIQTDGYIEDQNVVSVESDIIEFDIKESMRALLRETPLKQTVWNKLYKKELVEEILFEVGKYHEDEFWTYQVFHRAKKIVYIDIEMYYYFQRSDSIMGQKFSLKRLDAIEGRYRRLQLIEGKYPDLVGEAKENLAFLIMYYGQQAVRTRKIEKDEFLRSARSYLNKISFTEEEKRRYSKTHQLWIEGAQRNMAAICKIRNWLKIGIL